MVAVAELLELRLMEALRSLQALAAGRVAALMQLHRRQALLEAQALLMATLHCLLVALSVRRAQQVVDQPHSQLEL